MRTEDEPTVWSACVECYVSAAYGVDNVENDTRTDTERDTYRRTVAGHVVWPATTPDDVDEHGLDDYRQWQAVFAKYPCQACGSPLAGERHAVAGWRTA